MEVHRAHAFNIMTYTTTQGTTPVIRGRLETRFRWFQTPYKYNNSL